MSIVRLLAVVVLMPLLSAATLTSAAMSTVPLIRPVPAAVTAGPGWGWPIGPPRRVLRGFEAPPTPYSAGHRGIDLAALAGTPVYAPDAGIVAYAGMVAGRPVLSLSHTGDLRSSFEPVQALVPTGDAVRRGELVGVVASGSHCSGTCLHFGLRLHGQYVSPMLVLGGAARAVLLPLADR